MKKVDYICLITSILINMLIIFLITYRTNFTDINADSVKIGLIAIESSATTSFNNKKNIDSSIVNTETIQVSKETVKTEQKNAIAESEKEVVKEEVTKKEIVKEENSKVMEKTETEVAVQEVKKKPSLEDLKKSISSSKPKVTSSGDKSAGYNPSSESEEEVDRILGTISDSTGLISGSKVGTLDGEVLVKWNPNNRKPVFPESAQLSGKNGKVVILLKVDKFGNISSYRIEQGSGVPDIDIAIEKVIGTWKVNLVRKSKEIGGTFYIHYNFNLK